MQQNPLLISEGHIFAKLDGGLWLVDTGAPTSFGAGEFQLDGRNFRPASSYAGLTAESLSDLVRIPCTGLIGADILKQFDHLFDCSKGIWSISTEELEAEGNTITLEHFMGIPIAAAEIAGDRHRVFFDTGAQLSYLQSDSIGNFPLAGRTEDFYPGVGRFETETNMVEMDLGGQTYNLRCGRLPELLGATLMMAGTSGIVGNAVMMDRITGYFPRRSRLHLS